MLKFRAEKRNGGVLVGIGLEEENIKKLKEGKLIIFDLAELIGVEGYEVLLMYGRNQEHIKAQLVENKLLPDDKIKP